MRFFLGNEATNFGLSPASSTSGSGISIRLSVEGPAETKDRNVRPRERILSEWRTNLARTLGGSCIPDRSKSERKVWATLSSAGDSGLPGNLCETVAMSAWTVGERRMHVC